MRSGAMGELSEQQQTQLDQVDQLLTKADRYNDPPGSLLSLFLDTDDGSPRVSIGFGDVDTADQVTTLTHGIKTDTGNVNDWSQSAINMQKTTTQQLEKKGIDASVATVLFLEWDSGDTSNVLNIERPDAGAERMAQTLRGFEQANPGVQLDVVAHSLGTTTVSQMIADNPGLVENVFMYGSAGVSPEAASALEQQIRSSGLRVYATHAGEDFIAPFGRLPFSEHPIDPQTLDGVGVFSSDGGFVAGFGSGAGEYGEAVGGHNAQLSTEWYDVVRPGPNPDPTTHGSEMVLEYVGPSVGYLDTNSQSFKQTVVDLARAAESVDAG